MAARGTVVVIGLGRFGTSLALALVRRGADVLAVDIREQVVQQFSDDLLHVVCADGTDLVALQQIGVPAAAHAVVAFRSRLQTSMLCTLALAELKVPSIWVAASSPRHARILHHLGAHHVLQPDHEAAHRTAEGLTGHREVRIWHGGDDFAVATTSPEATARLTEAGLDAGVVAAIKTGDQIRVYQPGQTLTAQDMLIIAGQPNLVQRLVQGGE